MLVRNAVKSRDILFVSLFLVWTDLAVDGDDLFEGVDGEDLADDSQARVDSGRRVSSHQDNTVDVSVLEL